MSRRLIITGMSGLVAVAFLAASPTSAASIVESVKKLPGMHVMHPRDGVAGTISAISGSTLTLNDNGGPHATSTSAVITYTVDATNAIVFKDNATSSLDAILTGEKVFVKGTINGTNVSATEISAGTPPVHGQGQRNASLTKPLRPFGGNASTTENFRANFTLGNVTAIDGSNFTIADKGRGDQTATTYTVITDGSTVFKKAGQSAVLSDVTVGQFVMVAGAKNSANNAITATSVNVVTKKPEHGPRGHNAGAI